MRDISLPRIAALGLLLGLLIFLGLLDLGAYRLTGLPVLLDW